MNNLNHQKPWIYSHYIFPPFPIIFFMNLDAGIHWANEENGAECALVSEMASNASCFYSQTDLNLTFVELP